MSQGQIKILRRPANPCDVQNRPIAADDLPASFKFGSLAQQLKLYQKLIDPTPVRNSTQMLLQYTCNYNMKILLPNPRYRKKSPALGTPESLPSPTVWSATSADVTGMA